MIKWLNKLKMKAILPVAVVIATAAIGTTFAWQHWELGITNHLKAHDTIISVDEGEGEDGFKPYVQKKVKFKNEGTSSAFIRVSYVEYWETKKDGETYLLSNQSGNKNVAVKKWTEKWPEYSATSSSCEWTKMDDGWFYYNKILKGNTSTEEILTNVELITPLPEEYLNADYHLYFKVESVQCSDGSNTLNRDEVNANATKAVFGVSPTNIDYMTGEVTWLKN